MAGTFTGKALGQAALDNTEGDVYTVPALTVARVTQLVLCNSDSVDRTVRVWAIPPAGSSAIANAIFYDFTVPANMSIFEEVNMFLAAGAKIRGLASVAAVVSCQAYGIEEV